MAGQPIWLQKATLPFLAFFGKLAPLPAISASISLFGAIWFIERAFL
ncbi:hypothetical protein J2Y02_002187 [Neobacillus drentensis]|nr:hypothetical protein [Neobacillus drentensis]